MLRRFLAKLKGQQTTDLDDDITRAFKDVYQFPLCMLLNDYLTNKPIVENVFLLRLEFLSHEERQAYGGFIQHHYRVTLATGDFRNLSSQEAFLLAIACQRGLGVKVNEQLAVNLYTQAMASKDNMFAPLFLGTLYLNRSDKAKADELYQEAYRRGSKRALTRLHILRNVPSFRSINTTDTRAKLLFLNDLQQHALGASIKFNNCSYETLAQAGEQEALLHLAYNLKCDRKQAYYYSLAAMRGNNEARGDLRYLNLGRPFDDTILFLTATSLYQFFPIDPDLKYSYMNLVKRDLKKTRPQFITHRNQDSLMGFTFFYSHDHATLDKLCARYQRIFSYLEHKGLPLEVSEHCLAYVIGDVRIIRAIRSRAAQECALAQGALQVVPLGPAAAVAQDASQGHLRPSASKPA